MVHRLFLSGGLSEAGHRACNKSGANEYRRMLQGHSTMVNLFVSQICYSSMRGGSKTSLRAMV